MKPWHVFKTLFVMLAIAVYLALFGIGVYFALKGLWAAEVTIQLFRTRQMIGAKVRAAS